MKFVVILFIFAMSSAQSIAQSNDLPPELAKYLTPVDVNSLQLLGHGIRSKSEPDLSIALACETDACARYRFVLFFGTHRAYFIGQPIIAPKSENEKALAKAIGMSVAQYFDYHPTAEVQRRVHRHEAMSFFTILVGGVLIGLSGPASGPGAAMTALKTGTFMLGSFFFLSDPKIMGALIGTELVHAKFDNSTGWNWTASPKIIKGKNFDLTFIQIIKGNMRRYTGPNTFEYVGRDEWQLYYKYKRKKKRLMKRGVEFSKQVYEPF